MRPCRTYVDGKQRNSLCEHLFQSLESAQVDSQGPNLTGFDTADIHIREAIYKLFSSSR